MKFVKVDNILIKALSFIKFIRIHLKFIIIFIGFTYQTIDLTITYLKYETVFSIQSESGVENIPAISLCLKSKQLFEEISKKKRKDETIGDFIYRSINCSLINAFKNNVIGCGRKSTIVESFTPFAFRCFTFLSDLIEEQTSSQKELHFDISEGLFMFMIDNSLDLPFIIHSPKIPPHLFTDLHRYQFQSVNDYRIYPIREKLLPFPYESDCYSYENNIHDSKAPKSYQDCIVKKMAKLEENNCISHRRWTYDKLFFMNSTSGNRTFECLKKIFHLSKEVICKKSCLNEYLTYDLVVTMTSPIMETESYLIIESEKEFSAQLYNHFPKLIIIDYLSTFGGLVSFWYGYFIFQISIYFFERLKKVFVFLWKKSRLSQKLKQAMVKMRILIGLLRNSSAAVFIINFILLTVQLIPLFQNYNESKILTRVEILKDIYLPQLKIFVPFENYYTKNVNEMKNLYRKYGYNAKLNETKKNLHYINSSIASQYLVDLLKENKFEQFSKFFNPTFIIKSCIIYSNRDEFDCGQISSGFDFKKIEGKLSISTYHLLLFSNSNKAQKVFMTQLKIIENLEKVSLKIKRMKELFASINLDNEIPSQASVALIDDKKYLSFYYSTNIMQKINSVDYRCNEDRNDVLFLTDDYTYDCLQEKKLRILNKTNGCLFLEKYGQHISVGLENDLKTNKYKLCPEMNQINNQTIDLDKLKYKCTKYCKTFVMRADVKFLISTNYSEDVIVNLIPKYKFNIKYSNYFQINFNKFIYDCAGVISLYFGLSSVKLVDLIMYFILWLKSILHSSINYLKKFYILLTKLWVLVLNLLLESLRILSISVKLLLTKSIVLCILLLNLTEKLILFIKTSIHTLISIISILMIKFFKILITKSMINDFTIKLLEKNFLSIKNIIHSIICIIFYFLLDIILWIYYKICNDFKKFLHTLQD
jgi:hypothetical protein